MQTLPPPSAAGHRMIRWCAAGLLAAVASVYWNSRNAPFIFDDFPAVVRNLSIRNLGRLGTVLQPPLEGAGVTGRPLVNLSFAVDYALHGLDVRGYHLGSVLLHALGTLALFGVLRRTFLQPVLRGRWGDGATGRAAGIALLWAVHPLLTESVVCIAQRNEVLGGLFYLLTLYGFIRSMPDPETGDLKPGRQANRLWLAGSVCACLLGMASKEIVATAPLLVLLYDRTFVAGSFSAAWRQRWGFYLLLASTWLLLGWLMLGSNQRAGIVGFGLGMSPWDYLVTQCRALALYLKLSVWPHPLVVDYGPVTFKLAEVWREAAGVVALGLGTLWALWRRPVVGFLGAWFFVILAPSSSFVPLTTQTMAEHRMYLPLVAVVAGGLLALELLTRRGRPWLVGALAVVLGCVTVRRNAGYLDELHFWTETIARQPANARLRASLGYYHLRHKEWNEAIAAYEQAISLRENFADAHSDLSSLLLEVGRLDEALAHARFAASLKPDDAAIRFNYGVALAKGGDAPAAAREWQEALRLRPGLGVALDKLGGVALAGGQAAAAAGYFARAVSADATDIEAWSGWGQALTMQNHLPEAEARFQAALKLQPDLAELHYNLGNVWLGMNRPADARAAYQEALRLRPEFAAASHNLALALVRLGRPAEAIPHYQQVLRLLPGSALTHHNFSLALERAGRMPEAIAEDEQALRLDPDLAEAREHLAQLRGK